ncbi:MAG: ribonuclease H family protein [Paraprevotella sp.]|nr:ribonuclease H family protein [Paraprevotella sp.]
MGKRKYYVVWNGVNPGIYTDWTSCKLQINGVDGALYKSFDTREAAEEAYASSPYIYIGKKTAAPKPPQSPAVERADSLLCLPMEVPAEALAVDAACSGNPGPMEYRGIYLRTGEVVFHFGPVYGTNNIGEFLAIVHALALMKQKGVQMPIFSDSRNALSWVRQKRCKTKLERNARTEELYVLIERAEAWLKSNTWSTPLCKWETEKWGEIPADFGRK